MRKTISSIILTGLMLVVLSNAPALASVIDKNTANSNNITDNDNQTSNNPTTNDTQSASTDQSVKYFNVKLADANKSLLLLSYVVQNGDTLDSIAQKYAVNADVLKFLNQLPDNNVQPGQTLIVALPQDNTITVSLKPVNGDTANAANTANTAVARVTKVDPTVPKDPNPMVLDPSIKNFTQSDLNMLAHVVYGEARGETFNGQVAVAAVALNRLKSPLFPKTLAGVIFEPWAFTAVSDGQYNLTPNDQAYIAAKVAMKGFDPSNGALFYWNPKTATSRWVWSRQIIETLGNHVFAR